MPSPVSLAIACTSTAMSGFTGYPLMDGDICNLPPMHASTTIEYSRILDQGFYITQSDGHMSYELLRATFGHYFRWIKNICLLSNTEALVDYVSPKKGKVDLKFFNLFTCVLKVPVDGVEPPICQLHAHHTGTFSSST